LKTVLQFRLNQSTRTHRCQNQPWIAFEIRQT